MVGQDNAVGIATYYGVDGPGIESRLGRHFPHPFRPALGPTHPPIQGVRVYFPGVKRSGLTLSTHIHLVPRLKKEQSYIPTPPLGLHGLF